MLSCAGWYNHDTNSVQELGAEVTCCFQDKSRLGTRSAFSSLATCSRWFLSGWGAVNMQLQRNQIWQDSSEVLTCHDSDSQNEGLNRTHLLSNRVPGLSSPNTSLSWRSTTNGIINISDELRLGLDISLGFRLSLGFSLFTMPSGIHYLGFLISPCLEIARNSAPKIQLCKLKNKF